MDTVLVHISEDVEKLYYANIPVDIGDRVVVPFDNTYVVGTIIQLYVEKEAEDIILTNIEPLIREDS